MKLFAKIFVVSMVVALIAGCASDTVYVPRTPPQAQAKLLDYFEQPDNKVFVIAIDPGGDFAYGYDYGKPTLKAAAKVAVEKCDAQREAHGIVAKPYVYALNDKVVFEEMIRAAHKKKGGADGERKAQKEQVEKADAKENPDAAAAEAM